MPEVQRLLPAPSLYDYGRTAGIYLAWTLAVNPSRQKPFPVVRHNLRPALACSDPTVHIRTRDQWHSCQKRKRSQSPGTAKKSQKPLEHRSRAFAPDNLRSTWARASASQLDALSGSNLHRMTCRHSLSRLPSAPVCIEIVVLEVRLALESSCARHDAAADGDAARRSPLRAAGHQGFDQRFCTGIARLKTA